MACHTYIRLIRHQVQVCNLLMKALTHLCHFVLFAFPAQSLIIIGFLIGSDKDWLPMRELACALAHVENPHICNSPLGMISWRSLKEFVIQTIMSY